MRQATYESFADSSMLPISTQNEMGEEVRAIVPLRTSLVIVTTAYGDKVAFAKTNRGKQYRDLRGRKTEKRDDWGDKKTVKRPLYIGEEEVKAELVRLLQCSATADRAFWDLQA